MKFTGSILGKLLLIILCLLLGAVIALGGLVGGIYVILTSSTVGTMTESVSDYLPEEMELKFGEDVKEMTVLAWGQELLAKLTAMDTTTVGELESLLGYGFVSSALQEVAGVNPADIEDSTFDVLGERIADAMTLNTLNEKFDITLPDMPIFSDPDFLEQPISIAFEGFEDHNLDEFVVIDENSHVVMQEIADLKLNELGNDKFDEKINGLYLKDIITIDENSNSVLKELQNKTLGELSGTEIDETINSMFLCEIMDIDGTSGVVMQALKYASIKSETITLDIETYNASTAEFKLLSKYNPAYEVDKYQSEYLYAKDGTAYVIVNKNGLPVLVDGNTKYLAYKTKLYGEGTEKKYYPVKGVKETSEELTVKDVMEIDENNKLLNSLKDTRITEMDKAIDVLFMEEIMEITESSPRVINAIRYSALRAMTVDIAKSSVLPESSVPAEYTEKQLGKYTYAYVSDGTGGLKVYVINENATPSTGNYNVYETKLYNGKYYPIVGLDETLDNLTIEDVFTEEEMEEGALGLLDPSIRLNDISKEISDEISNATLTELIGTGVINDESFNADEMHNEQRAFIYNSSLTEMISGLIEFVSDPISEKLESPYYELNVKYIEPIFTYLTKTTYDSLDEFVHEYTYNYAEQFDTIILKNNVVVNVDETLDAKYYDESIGSYVIPIFNLDEEGGNYTLTFDTGAVSGDVKLGVRVGENLSEISKHQYAFAYDASNAGAGSGLNYTGGNSHVYVDPLDNVMIYEYLKNS